MPGSPDSPHNLGIGKLAERLILEHPDWTYAALADEVNRQISGAQATASSVRWYASKMRAAGHVLPKRRRSPRTSP